jgi:fructose-1,6-bisphosphatase/inositol monophosphatase family enzyme
MGAYDKEKEFVIGLLRELGNLQMSFFGSFVPPSLKDQQGDPNAIGNPDVKKMFSRVDKDCQEYCLSKLYPAFKKDGVIPEEDTFSVSLFDQNKASRRQWVVDPLDGSYLFTHKKPSFGSVVGLMEDSKYVLGAMYQSKEKILYLAVKDEGVKKFVGQDDTGIEVKLSNSADLVPHVGDLVLLGGGVHHRVSPILNEQMEGLIFRHEENLCSVDRTRKVLEGQAKAYLRHQSTIYGMGPQAFMVEQAGGAAIGLNRQPPEWTTQSDGLKIIPMLKSYAILGPKEYCHLLASRIHEILSAYSLV